MKNGNCGGTEQLRKIKFFNRGICVCAHLTQTRYAQKACAEIRGNMEFSEQLKIYAETHFENRKKYFAPILSEIEAQRRRHAPRNPGSHRTHRSAQGERGRGPSDKIFLRDNAAAGCRGISV